MPLISVHKDIRLNVEDRGSGAPVVFLHALGLDLHLWDGVVSRLPDGLRAVRLDLRGHGKSDVPAAPYPMGGLVGDVEQVMQALGLREAVVVGISLGGMIAQGLAAKRLDLVRGIVLSNTATKIATREVWADRIAMVEAQGTAALAEATIERWFSKSYRAAADVTPWRARLSATDDAGFSGCAAAIAGADFYSTTAALRLPALVIAGAHDGSTPPDMVREMADLIPGARFELLRGSGHLPPIDAPEETAQLLTEFLRQIGHLA
ncbi:MAG: 3-oxoadipate enol-lactonase [Pseudomonadota bacterium]